MTLLVQAVKRNDVTVSITPNRLTEKLKIIRTGMKPFLADPVETEQSYCSILYM